MGTTGVSYDGKGERFGNNISISDDGTRIAIIAYSDMQSGQTQSPPVGSVRIYDYAASAWTQKGADIYGIETGTINRTYSAHNGAIKLSGDGSTIFIAQNAPFDNNYGVAAAYRFSSSAWNQIGLRRPVFKFAIAALCTPWPRL